MKLLIDENLPKRLKQDFPDHEIYTVRDMGWQSKKNGELLALMIANSFDVLITFDKNLRHQQNFARYPIAVLVLNTWDNLSSIRTVVTSHNRRISNAVTGWCNDHFGTINHETDVNQVKEIRLWCRFEIKMTRYDNRRSK